MSDNITVTGVVATTPRHVVTPEKLPVTSFRIASTPRRYDRGQQKWVDGDTNWFSVVAFRQLAINLVGSIDKGQRVVVTGRLQIKDWNNGEKSGTEVEIVSDAVGHDLSWGTSVFSRSATSSTTNPRGRTRASGCRGGVGADGGRGWRRRDTEPGDEAASCSRSRRPEGFRSRSRLDRTRAPSAHPRRTIVEGGRGGRVMRGRRRHGRERASRAALALVPAARARARA